MAKKRIGHCVYCGSRSELTDEHVIPLSLLLKDTEEWILEKASCKACAKKTNRFETEITKYVLKAFREAVGAKTRNRGREVKHFLEVVRNGEVDKIEVSRDQALQVLPFPLFIPPGYFLTAPDPTRVTAEGIGFLHGVEGPRELGERLGVDAIGFPKLYRIDVHTNEIEYGPKMPRYMTAFLQLIAKIGHCYAVSCCPREDFEELYLANHIIGSPVGLGYWVGQSLKVSLKNKSLYWEVVGQVLDGDFIVRLRLYHLHSEVPEYVVVVGRVKPNVRALLRSLGNTDA